jgi:hypothetical protein
VLALLWRRVLDEVICALQVVPIGNDQ